MRLPFSRETLPWLVVWCAFLVAGVAHAQDAAVRWAAKISGGWISFSSPAFSPDGSIVYIGFERGIGGGGLAALRTESGSALWVYNVSEPVDTTPTIAPDGTIYIGSVNGTLYALTPSMVKRWEYNAGSFISSSPAIGADGTLYFGTGGGRVVALTADGQEQWSFQTGARIFSSPSIGRDDTIYVGSDDGYLYALNTLGQERWRFRTDGPITGSPAVGWDGTIYIGSIDQTLYAIKPDGSLKWSYLTDGLIDASPVLGADGTVYFPAGDTRFYALNAESDDEERLKWRSEMQSSSASTPAVRGDGIIIVGADDGQVRAFHPDTGNIVWSFQTNDEIYSSPAVAADGSIYIGSLDGNLYKLNGNQSPLSTVSSWPGFQRNAARSARMPPFNGARLINLSARVAAAGTDTLIAGFFVAGGSGHPFLLRAVGPTLVEFDVNGFMPNPFLDLYSGSTRISSNDDWSDAHPPSGLGAFPLPAGSKDAAMLRDLSGGLYTTHVKSVNGDGGVVLVEVYDANNQSSARRLVNLSMRSQVGVGEQILIVGFVVQGDKPSRLLIRAVGPSLAQFGVANVLERPSISVYRDQTRLQTNTGWTTGGVHYDLAGAAKSVGAFPLNQGSADSAFVLTLDPGSYTVQVSGVGDTTGEALAEIYVLP